MTPLQERRMLLTHGTRAFRLKPTSIIQAAQQDLELRSRKVEFEEEASRVYAFCRKHVVKAKTVADLLRLALEKRDDGLASNKYNTLLIYGDEELLREALGLAEADTASVKDRSAAGVETEGFDLKDESLVP